MYTITSACYIIRLIALGFRTVTPLYKPYPFTLSTGKPWHPGVPWGSLKKEWKSVNLDVRLRWDWNRKVCLPKTEGKLRHAGRYLFTRRSQFSSLSVQTWTALNQIKKTLHSKSCMMYFLNNGTRWIHDVCISCYPFKRTNTHKGGKAVECLPLLRKVAGLSPHKRGLMDCS